jgi:beta-carotene ketolase (CrtW type)
MSREVAQDARGVALAVSLLLGWAGSLVGLLAAPLDGPLAPLWVPLAVAWMSWLFTGLFITAHDAMHGAITRAHPRLNHGLGALAVAAFAMFDYRLLRRAHVQHHARPAREGDPDWHDGRHPGPLRWLWTFMRRYLTLGQWLRLVAVFWGLQALVALPNLLLFWALPSVLSTLQLFFFGTWLPHREPPGGHRGPHRATSGDYSDLVSLLTCYHFGGYHREHHEHPALPWWRLPETAQRPTALPPRRSSGRIQTDWKKGSAQR